MIPSGFHVGGRDDSVRLPCWRPRTALSSDIARGRRHLTTQLLGRLGSRLNQHPACVCNSCQSPGICAVLTGKTKVMELDQLPARTSSAGSTVGSLGGPGLLFPRPAGFLRLWRGGMAAQGGQATSWQGSRWSRSGCKLSSKKWRRTRNMNSHMATALLAKENFVLSFACGVWSRRPQS